MSMYKPLGIVMRAYGGCYRELMGWKRYFKPPGERASDQVSPTNTHWRLGEKRNCPTSSHHPHVEQENHSSCFKKNNTRFFFGGTLSHMQHKTQLTYCSFLCQISAASARLASSLCAQIDGQMNTCVVKWTRQ